MNNNHLSILTLGRFHPGKENIIKDKEKTPLVIFPQKSKGRSSHPPLSLLFAFHDTKRTQKYVSLFQYNR